MELYLVGALAAVLTSALWTINAILFTSAGKRIGAISVNAWRILLAALLLWITHLLMTGEVFPVGTSEQYFWIGLSGIIGLGIGDFGLFASFVIIGTRRAVLLMSLSAIFAAIAAFFLFNETLTIVAFMGVAVTLAGVITVLLEDEAKSDEEKLTRKQKIKGIGLATIGGIGQGLGLAFLKKGMLIYPNVTEIPAVVELAIASTLIRMIFGALFVWAVVTLWGKLPEIKKAMKDKKGMKYVTMGAFIGPFVGVTLSTIAAYTIEVGVAQTLMSLMPVMIIPVVWILFKQKTGWQGIVGAVIAVIGVAILFLI